MILKTKCCRIVGSAGDEYDFGVEALVVDGGADVDSVVAVDWLTTRTTMKMLWIAGVLLGQRVGSGRSVVVVIVGLWMVF